MPETNPFSHISPTTWIIFTPVACGFLWLVWHWWGRQVDAQRERFIMSHAPEQERSDTRPTDQSIDQSVPTSLDKQTAAQTSAGLDELDELDAHAVLPDMDAQQTGMVIAELPSPPASRYLTDDEFVMFLAMQKLRNGQYRMTANKIVQAAGGDRSRVLRLVKEVREGPADYPQRTPEQQAVREALGLDRVQPV